MTTSGKRDWSAATLSRSSFASTIHWESQSPQESLEQEADVVLYILFWIVIAAKLAVNFSSFARHVTTNVKMVRLKP